jgi:hypothetical protein
MTKERVQELMLRACAALKGECKTYPLRPGLVTPLENGWTYLDYVTVVAKSRC